jgi:hypothetical protein
LVIVEARPATSLRSIATIFETSPKLSIEVSNRETGRFHVGKEIVGGRDCCDP